MHLQGLSVPLPSSSLRDGMQICSHAVCFEIADTTALKHFWHLLQSSKPTCQFRACLDICSTPGCAQNSLALQSKPCTDNVHPGRAGMAGRKEARRYLILDHVERIRDADVLAVLLRLREYTGMHPVRFNVSPAGGYADLVQSTWDCSEIFSPVPQSTLTLMHPLAGWVPEALHSSCSGLHAM